MSIIEVDMFTKLNKVDTAMALIKEHEPPEGYQVCLSAGGKDSQVAEHLCRIANVRYDLVYCQTGIDPPEAMKFMREHYPNVIVQKPKWSIFRGIEKKGLPRRNSRWCCELLKEYSGEGRVLITGIRAEESWRRKNRGQVSKGRNKRIFVSPIFYWTESEVWEYIDSNFLPYCELYDIDGWDRLGCVMCPFTTWRRALFEWERYPKIAQAWFRAAARYWHNHPDGKCRKYGDPVDFVLWWLSKGQVSIETIKYEINKRGLTINIK